VLYVTVDRFGGWRSACGIAVRFSFRRRAGGAAISVQNESRFGGFREVREGLFGSGSVSAQLWKGELAVERSVSRNVKRVSSSETEVSLARGAKL
jgi:hypothetical protein